MMTTAEAAAALGVDESRVRRLCATGRIRARKHGASWAISPAALAAYQARGPLPPGPKPKPKKRKAKR